MLKTTETIVFCHYPTFFGILLGLIQYLPTILVFGSFFWTIKTRDALFLCLGIVLEIIWFLGILLKYFLFPVIIGLPLSISSQNYTSNIDPRCDSYIPSLLGYISVLFFESPHQNTTNGKLFLGTEFPHLDTLEAGVYDGFIILYLLLWVHPIDIYSIFGLLLLCFVPWSFISAGYTSASTIGVSFFMGFLLGGFSLWISFRITKSCRNNKSKHWWCGTKTIENGLFFYE